MANREEEHEKQRDQIPPKNLHDQDKDSDDEDDGGDKKTQNLLGNPSSKKEKSGSASDKRKWDSVQDDESSTKKKNWLSKSDLGFSSFASSRTSVEVGGLGSGEGGGALRKNNAGLKIGSSRSSVSSGEVGGASGFVSKEYKCTYCSRKFDKKEALGGHMSSHAIQRDKQTRAIQRALHTGEGLTVTMSEEAFPEDTGEAVAEDTTEALPDNSEQELPEAGASGSGSKKFVCKYCGKTFPSFQAKAGHTGWCKKGLQSGEAKEAGEDGDNSAA